MLARDGRGFSWVVLSCMCTCLVMDTQGRTLPYQLEEVPNSKGGHRVKAGRVLVHHHAAGLCL